MSFSQQSSNQIYITLTQMCVTETLFMNSVVQTNVLLIVWKHRHVKEIM